MDLYRWRLFRNDFTAEAAEGTEEEMRDKLISKRKKEETMPYAPCPMPHARLKDLPVQQNRIVFSLSN